ncbi:ATP synthase subunit I [Weizmannia coagulans]|uniref:ATP synthase F0 subunit I n=3 Tax=Heyndrickxia TaxID=2837504 RepID=A0A0C5CI57_HEYCO|nr:MULTISPECIES: ATP synthase subunit I [Heyndrickxia]NWN93513.1 ATP synthase subunit I [Bacillus sp. (in: firmicutes)]AEP00660.1 ATP synthase F0 subunit I [Heyndrickxia coagulans 36D1]AJO21017.1 ATP synthase F0 subunit I [Heyndrickxia coagulans]AKN53343.1 ATP synthase protein I [Heyndrickxia coagulans]ATW81703.1 ATP synthase subunit I [Heyndrickxia coagulans]
MPELLRIYKRLRKYLVILLCLYLTGAMFPGCRSVFLGLLLGTAVSLFNLWLMVKKTLAVTDVSSGKKRVSLGTGMRMATAVLAVAVALRFPDLFHLLAVVIGVMTSYLVIMIDFFVGLLQQRKK